VEERVTAVKMQLFMATGVVLVVCGRHEVQPKYSRTAGCLAGLQDGGKYSTYLYSRTHIPVQQD
jgi:hypothetical protein